MRRAPRENLPCQYQATGTHEPVKYDKSLFTLINILLSKHPDQSIDFCDGFTDRIYIGQSYRIAHIRGEFRVFVLNGPTIEKTKSFAKLQEIAFEMIEDNLTNP